MHVNNLFDYPYLDLTIKILKALQPSSVLATCPAHFNLLRLITLTILDESTDYEIPRWAAFFTPHSHPFSAQIIALRLGYI